MNSRFVFFLLPLLCLTACRTTYNMSSVDLEILIPAMFTMPERMDTIAIFKRDCFKSDTITYQYFNDNTSRERLDSSIHYSDLSNHCVDALANTLEEEGYFLKVINYRDSMNYLLPPDSLTNYQYWHHQLGADAFVFLDYFTFKNIGADHSSKHSFFMTNIMDVFPEFKSSTDIETIEAALLWTVTFKGDTSIYLCQQPDNLYYGSSVYPELFGNEAKHKLLLKNTAHYLGRKFATRLIPSWETVQRTFYRSHNEQMQVAEKYFIENDWLKAAEIYSSLTSNKNRNIAAKAKFNMAIICEMEGNMEAAFDWLELSDSTYKFENTGHKFNCKKYGLILDMRKSEIEKLDLQARSYARQFQN